MRYTSLKLKLKFRQRFVCHVNENCCRKIEVAMKKIKKRPKNELIKSKFYKCCNVLEKIPFFYYFNIFFLSNQLFLH